MTGGDQISLHELRVYEAVREDSGWKTAKEIASRAQVADRTARHHAQGLVTCGVFEVAKVFGGYRYRIETRLAEPAREYVAQLESAKRIFAV